VFIPNQTNKSLSASPPHVPYIPTTPTPYFHDHNPYSSSPFSPFSPFSHPSSPNSPSSHLFSPINHQSSPINAVNHAANYSPNDSTNPSDKPFPYESFATGGALPEHQTCLWPDNTSSPPAWRNDHPPPTKIQLINPNKTKPKSKGEDTIVNQNVNGIIRAWKLEAIIQNMIDHNIDAYLIQKTWLPGE
jgi:hypothetical protein